MSNLAYGTFTITNLSIVTSVDIYYYNSTSSSSLSGGSWSTDTPTWTNGKYIWSKTVTTWEQGVTTESEPVCITGQKGSTGAAGQSVTRITQQYALSTSSTTAPTSGWSTTMPTFESGKFYWTRSEIVWANPTSTTYTTAVLANGITSANTTAAVANTNANTAVSTANSANTKADNAVSTANTANQTAQNAVSVANGKSTIYYSSSKPTGGTYKAGDTWFNLTSDGYRIYEYNTTSNDWVQKSMDGKSITAGTVTAAQIQAGAITTNKLATNAIKSTNYNAGTAPYSLTGTFLDLSNGNIFTPNFGVNNDSTDNIDNGAYIKGTIQAYDGKIGSDNNNYWYIGNYFDYNQGQSAMIRSHGTAAIQLGDNTTWRLSTNRIHTAWNDDSTSGEAFRLHYPSYGGKYWDSGLHVPTSATDKLLYIRNANTTVSLENLQNDINDNSGGNYWNYQFYLTNDGSLYAKNIYIMDDSGNTTQIGGTDGVYLLKSGGTITGNLTVNGTLTATASQANALTHTLSINGQSWTGSSNLTINTLGTAYGGTGNTSYTTGGVVYVDGSNPKKLLSTAAGTSGYLLKSGGTGAPTWVDPGTLTVAAAAKDGDGNVIKTTYLKLTGGNVTGPVSFGDSVSIDDLNAGTLVVTGNASFTNNIQANTINGVIVGSNPKFTDTVTTISTEGNGNAITAIESTNGTLKAIKGATFLMTVTSTQVTNALGYTPYNATNPNGYTTNTGTITSVAASGSGGITISGSPITTSGTLAIGLNLSTAINGLGEGTSPANRDDYAVVQYAGGGTTTTSYHRRKLSNVFKALIADDIPNLAWSKITSGNDDLKAIEALTGTSGFLKKTAANTWTLDTSAYVTSSGVTSITLTQGTGISIGSSGTAITSTGTRTIALADNYGDTKNPYASKTARYVLAAPAAANGVPSFRALTNSDVGLSNVLNIKQVTGIGQGDNGKIRVFKGTGTNDYEDIAVEIVATSTSSVASSQKLTSYGGSATQPVYFPADGANAGKPVAISYTIEKSVPSNAVFTDTWNKVSTAQDGYVTKLPGNTTTFLRGDGTWGTPSGTYSLPLAANGTRGGVQIGYSSSGKNYAVQLSSQKMYVNVPWSDTTYSAGTGLSLSGTTFSNSGVTGVKGNSESSYRTGQVNLTATNIGLGNVENKSSATIRGELTSSNVISALGYTPTHNISLGGHSDYDRCVIALCETSATNTEINSWSNGVLMRQRDNGLIATKVAYVTFNGAYGTAYAAYYSLLCNHENISLEARGVTEGFRACTFTYNNKRYAGLEFYQVQSSVFFYTQFGGTFTPFMVRYYNTNSATVKNSEINDSLVYGSSTLFRQPFIAQQANSLTNKVLDSLTINNTAGSFTFQGNGMPWDGTDWVGLQVGSNDDKFQIHALNGTTLEYRQNDSGGTNSNWGDWQSLLSSGNYIDYTVTKTGSGASGTWGISITGNAATATKWTSAQTVYVALGTVSTSTTIQGGSSSAQMIGVNGTLSVGNGGTGKTTGKDAANYFLNSLDTGSSTPVDTDYYISQYVNGGTTTTTYHRRPMSALWNYIKEKGDSTYVTIGTSQTITGRKTFSNLAAVTFKPSSGTDNCSINYDSTLGALVFSF